MAITKVRFFTGELGRAAPTHAPTGRPPPGRGGAWESESLRVFNTRQESGNGTRELRTGSRSVPQYGDPDPRLGPALPSDYPDMGGGVLMRRIAMDYDRLAKLAEEQLADQERGAIGD